MRLFSIFRNGVASNAPAGRMQHALTLAAFAFALAFTFSCSFFEDEEEGNGGDRNLVGKWYFSETLADAGSATGLAYEFKSGGKMTISSSMTGYSWSASGGKITTYYSGKKVGTAKYAITSNQTGSGYYQPIGSGNVLTLTNADKSGLVEGTYYRGSPSSTTNPGTTTHPIVNTSWNGKNSNPSPYNNVNINFYDGTGITDYYDRIQFGSQASYLTNYNTFTYTISGSTITMSVGYNDSRTFTYSGGNTFYLGGITFTKK